MRFMLRSNVNRVNDGRLDGRLFYWEKQNERALEYAPGGITGIGGWLGYFLGGCDGLLYALIAFTVIDYISGVMYGIVDNLLENAAHLGLPIPAVVRKALNQLHDKSENKESENGK